jgi:hypothetical protein
MADGIKIASQEVFADYSSNGLRFTFRQGGLQSLATYRGEDDVVPEASGRAAGLWIADIREVTLHGLVDGVIGTSPSTEQDIREALATRYALLLTVMVPTALVTITVYPPHFGLGVGDFATLANCRPMRMVGPDPAELEWYRSWEGDLQFTCIDSPPEWSVDEAS